MNDLYIVYDGLYDGMIVYIMSIRRVIRQYFQ